MARQRIRLRKRDLRRLMSKAVARRKSAREIGGLLIDNGYFFQVRETRNISKRRGSFWLDWRETNSICRAAEKLGMKVVGTFHSHIVWFPEPGPTDIRGAEDDSFMLIIDSMDRQVGLWRILHGRAYRRRFELI
jgi:proteasome lid subunit RPN8/RPN11